MWEQIVEREEKRERDEKEKRSKMTKEELKAYDEAIYKGIQAEVDKVFPPLKKKLNKDK